MRREENEQISFIRYARTKYPWIITIVSPIVKYGGTKIQRLIQGKKIKDMGYVKGSPDVFFPYPRAEFHGLFIELKTEIGRTSPEQKAMISALLAEGYCVVVCKGFDEAVWCLDRYMSQDKGRKTSKIVGGLGSTGG